MTNSILEAFVKKALSDVKNKPKRGKNKPAPTPGETEYEINKRKLELFTLKQKTKKWTYTSVTLIVRESTCKCCGKTIEQWPDGVFITMQNPLLGIHEKNISEDYTPDLYPDIPRKIEFWKTEIPTCLECFKAEEPCTPEAPEQLDLFAEEKRDYSLSDPLVNERNKISQLNFEITNLESKDVRH